MKRRDLLSITILSGLLFLPFLGSVHLFDWDEINFAESAREMLLTGNWFQIQINFEPFWEKPPLFFWMQASAMNLFGVNEFSARLPNALCGIATLLIIFQIGLKTHDRTVGWIWVLLYLGSFLPHLYFRSGIIDPWFNLFIFLAIYFLYKTLHDYTGKELRNAAISGAFIGLAILTKGPVGLLLLILTLVVWLIRFRNGRAFPWAAAGVFAGVAFLVTTLWFGYETVTRGPWFLREFIAYQVDLLLNPVAGHKQPFFYHFVVVFLGCFPLSILALPSFSKQGLSDQSGFSSWMKTLFWVVMILFSLVTTKIVHYSSMAYLPLSYLGAVYLGQIIKAQSKIVRWQRNWLLIQGALIGALLAGAPLAIQFKDQWIDLVNDPFARGNLSVDIHMHGWEWIIGVGYLAVLIIAYQLFRKDTCRAIRTLTLGTAITIFGVLLLIVPKIEAISQRSAIEFFESQAKENVHLETYGYKSYAHYFYGEITPQTAHSISEDQLLTSEIPVMVSMKIQRKERFMEAYPEAEFLYEKGGFAFYRLD